MDAQAFWRFSHLWMPENMKVILEYFVFLTGSSGDSLSYCIMLNTSNQTSVSREWKSQITVVLKWPRNRHPWVVKATLVNWYRIATLKRFCLASRIPNKSINTKVLPRQETINVIGKVKENQVRCILECIPCTRYYPYIKFILYFLLL